LFSGECGYVSVLFLCTGGLIRGQGSYVYICYRVLVGCLVDRSAILCVY
jgi:hypothetical protein